MNTLFRNEIIHFISALLGAVVFYSFTHNFSQSIILIIVALAIDVDHLIDYFIYLRRSNKTFSFSYFLAGKYFHAQNRIYVFFHAWEWVVILLLYSLAGWGSIYGAIAAGLAIHYVVDTATNNVTVDTYLLSVRVIEKFRLDTIVTK